MRPYRFCLQSVYRTARTRLELFPHVARTRAARVTSGFKLAEMRQNSRFMQLLAGRRWLASRAPRTPDLGSAPP